MLTPNEIRALLARLDGEPADAIESEVVECKSWNPHPSARDSQLRELRETVVCLANQRGGVLILGVADRKRTRRDAIQGVGDLDPLELRRSVYVGTEPHILIEVEELIEPEGRLLLLRVPRGLPPHTTSEGVGQIRVGKECRPLTGTILARLMTGGGQRDLSAEILTGATFSDLDPEAIQALKRSLETEGSKPDLARLSSEQILHNLGLVHQGEITLAAILLLGNRPALARWAPRHDVIFLRFKTATRYDVRHDLKGPILTVLEELRRLLEAHLKLTTVETNGFAELHVPDLTWWAAREAILNAFAHRDYFLQQSIQIELHEDRAVVTSPGGFIGGVNPQNVLRHSPVRRNSLLAESFQTLGLVNRAGLGVDRIYEELLRSGKALPRYEADEASVQLTLPTRTHDGFARFVASRTREGRRLDLDELILLRTATDRGRLDRWSAADCLQAPEEAAAARLVELREAGLLEPEGRGRGTTYRLPDPVAELIWGSASAFPHADALKQRTLTLLRERGRLNNAEVRELTGQSRSDTLRMMRALRGEGLVRFDGRGRSASYVPGPRLVAG
ncbi:MAG: hypothetical protein HC897_10195 [Thermoanaerobaculia bacterium]|nr:hypothetical protein [Thermoanaerobaculia bacterium]